MNSIVINRKNGVDVSVSLDDPAAIEAAINELELDLSKIKAQLEDASMKRSTTGEYADPHWFSSARAAQRFKGAAHQRLLRRLAELKRAGRASREWSMERKFIEVARRRLEPETFDSILAEAKGED